MTTLAGYIHWKLTGRKVLGVGDASGMFPIDPATGTYYGDMVEKFEKRVDGKYPWKLTGILPEVLSAGEDAGTLTPEGAALLDVSGKLQRGSPLPSGGRCGHRHGGYQQRGKEDRKCLRGNQYLRHAGPGRELRSTRPEVELVAGPDKSQVAMAHCNNCTSDLNAWMGLFKEFADTMGMRWTWRSVRENVPKSAGGRRRLRRSDGLQLFFRGADHQTGGRQTFVYTETGQRLPSGQFHAGPYLFRHGDPEDRHGYPDEGGKSGGGPSHRHGGFFKTKGVGQNLMASAFHTPVTVMETAGEGGAWGIALLAAYRKEKKAGESLAEYLENRVFAGQKGETVDPDPKGRGRHRRVHRKVQGLSGCGAGAVENFR